MAGFCKPCSASRFPGAPHRAGRAACVERARELLGAELAALVGESYERAYGDMVRVQQLTELEETVDYSLALALAQGAPRPPPAAAVAHAP